jgi:hypothetical protein
MGVDQGEQAFQQLGRQVVTHAFDDFEAGAGDGLGRVDAAGQRHQRVGGAVDDQGRHGDRLQLRAAVAAGGHGQQLAHHPARTAIAPQRARDALAQVLFRGRIGGAADQAEAGDRVFDGGIDVGRVARLAQQRAAAPATGRASRAGRCST